jgi:hypothetical protein
MPLSKNDINLRLQNSEDRTSLYASIACDPSVVGTDFQKALDLWNNQEQRYYRLYDEVEYGIKTGRNHE